MRLFGRSIRLDLDLAVRLALVAVLLMAAYLGLSVWLHNRSVEGGTPVSREIDALADLIRQQPNNMVARVQLAQALTIAGREDEAIEQYEAILTADEQNVSALSGLGFIASTRKDWATAEGYWQRIIDTLEGRPAANQDRALEIAYFYMGDVKAEQKKWEEAIPYYKAALRIKRDASDSHYHLAVAYREIGSLGKYEEELEIAIAFDPNMPEANYDMGKLLLESGDLAAAAEHFRVSANAAPAAEAPVEALADLGDAAEHLAKARELAKDDPKGALKEARIAVAVDPKDVGALTLAAQLYQRTGDKAKALETWNKVLAAEPASVEASAAIGELGGS